MSKIAQDIVKKIYAKRVPENIKYDFGSLLVIGGSDYYAGAPALAALAAMRSGVDMARIIAPRRASDIIAGYSPDIATTPLEGDYLEPRHVSQILEAVESTRILSRGNCALVIGGGIGRTPDTQAAVLEILKAVNISAVVDADALYAIKANPEIIYGKPFLLTPHATEFYMLTGNKVAGQPDEEKAKHVMSQAAAFGVTIVLKGATDIISDGKTMVYNQTGNPLMTKGGTGDTFAGIAGSLAARGCTLMDAAVAAAYINGAAGDLAGNKLGESMAATDLINEISNVLPKHTY